MSYSSKLPASSSTLSRSRAVSRPLACCAAMRFSPPPSRAAARLASSSSMVVAMCTLSAPRCHEGREASIAVDQLLELGQLPLVVGTERKQPAQRRIAGSAELKTDLFEPGKGGPQPVFL